MLPSRYRLRSSADIQDILKDGERQTSPHFKVLYYPRSSRENSRFAVIVGKKTTKKAVERNRIKRRLRAAIRVSLPCISTPSDIIVLGNRTVLEVEFSTLVRHMYAIFYKM